MSDEEGPLIHSLQGSTAKLCALDMSKAFDKMSHYGLYIKLMELSIPRCFIDILICWYAKCFGVVRYDNYLSSRFHVCAGVRQGGVLSHVLFSVFMNSLVIKLTKAGLGAHLGFLYVGCLLYADDIPFCWITRLFVPLTIRTIDHSFHLYTLLSL